MTAISPYNETLNRYFGETEACGVLESGATVLLRCPNVSLAVARFCSKGARVETDVGKADADKS
jgi:hypothetical protein